MSADRPDEASARSGPRVSPPPGHVRRDDAATIFRAMTPVSVEFTQFVDDTYLDWSVVEVDASSVPGSRGTHCLIFSRKDCIRRVWDYPRDWRTLDAAGLSELSWRR
jgi:hypothetical protein